jgi:hypothetical protein
MVNNPTTDFDELELFTGLLKLAINQDHAVMPRLIAIAHLVTPGDWVSATALACELSQASEQFHFDISVVAHHHRMLPDGERLSEPCPICGGSWCSMDMVCTEEMTESWRNFVTPNKSKE